MASFIANHRKKKERLKRNEEGLRRLIKSGASRERLLKEALAVRDSRIRVLRAKQNQNPERTAEDRAVFLRDEAKIVSVQALTAEAILGEYLPGGKRARCRREKAHKMPP